jgi:hypothetical protein
MKHFEWIKALKTMLKKDYWDKANTVEFFAFFIKEIIIVPGLLFGIELWWLYLLAFVSSFGIVWSSTIKTIPTLIWFNILWMILSAIVIIRIIF